MRSWSAATADDDDGSDKKASGFVNAVRFRAAMEGAPTMTARIVDYQSERSSACQLSGDFAPPPLTMS